MDRVWADRWWNFGIAMVSSVVGGAVAGFIVYLAVLNLQQGTPTRISLRLIGMQTVGSNTTYRVRVNNTGESTAHDCSMSISNVTNGMPEFIENESDQISVPAGGSQEFEGVKGNNVPRGTDRAIFVSCRNASATLSNVQIPRHSH